MLGNMKSIHIFANAIMVCIFRHTHIKNQIINFFMKIFKHLFFALAALTIGFAFNACTPDNMGGKNGKVSIDVTVAEVNASGAVINVATKGISDFAWLQNDSEIPATAIFGGGTVVTIEDATVVSTNEVTISGLEADTTYSVFFAFRDSAGEVRSDVEEVTFTTLGYTQALTVVEQMYDGFSVHVQIPEEVKARGNALRYSTSSLPMYNYMKSMGSIELDMLLYNAQQFTTEDKTIIYDEYHSTERDENGDLIYDEQGNLTSASYADPKVPGEPGVFMIGEFGYMDDENELIIYKDGEVSTVYDESLSDYAIWSYPAGWKPGYYRPEWDWKRWVSEYDTDAYDSEKYWTGYYERIQVNTLEPAKFDGTVEIKVSDLTPINALIEFAPTEDVVFYNVMIMEESEYQATVLPLLENNEDYLQWFVGSYFALYTFGSEMTTGDRMLMLTDWFVDTKGMAGKTIRVMVSAMGDNEGRSQSFAMTTFQLPEITKPAPEVVVTEVKSNNPYIAAFNIKAPGKDVAEAYFACNYVREFDDVLKEYTYMSLLQDMGNQLGKNEIDAINSDEGFYFEVSSRENATTRIAVLVYNDEGTANNPNATGSTAVCETTSARASYPTRVESELFDKLVGEWSASATMLQYETDQDTGEGTWKTLDTPYTSDVTISAGVEYPEELTEEVYKVYENAGVERAETDALFKEFKKLAREYNSRTRGFNRLLCLGFDFASEEYKLDTRITPWELFISEDFGFENVSDIFYDFGPKWNLEIDAEGKVWLPIDIEKEFPLCTFYFGMDYSMYMLAVGMNSYLGAPLYDKTGKLIVDSRFPVEVSEDGNTLTIKPIIYTYTNSEGVLSTETYYPCVAQLQYGQATPLMPRVGGDIVLTRKSAATASAQRNAKVSGGSKAEAINSLGEAPVPMARTYSMTPMSREMIKVYEPIVKEQKIEAGNEAFHKRAKAMIKGLYGIELK